MKSDLVPAIFVLLAACQGEAPLVSAPAVPAETAPSGASTAPASAAQPVSETPKADGVTLETPGEEPRRVLRLAPAAGTRQTLRVTVASRSEMRSGESGIPSAIAVPALQAELRVIVEPPAPEGGLQGELVLGMMRVAPDAKAAPELLGVLESTMSPLAGSRARWVRTARGAGPALALEAPVMATAPSREMLASLNDALAALPLGLPEEAVGPGARWVETAGGTRRRATLLRFDAAKAVIEVELETGGEVVTLPGMGMRKSARVAGKGLLTLDPASPLPVDAQVTLEQQAEVALPAKAGPPARFLTTTEITAVTP